MNKFIAYCGLAFETEKHGRRQSIMMTKSAGESQSFGRNLTGQKMINCIGCRLGGVKTPYCDSLFPIRQVRVVLYPG
ncbi:MAG: hypothetical protein II969_10520 [Anaerolineaceae bacterium]|nr:hypothetical protein [Anaerolineaceae bacterium]